ncbi:MAG: ATP-binding protein, partial [Gemmataceae bacterium]
MSDASSKNLYTPWELDAEAIVVKIRWFGVLVGYFLVNFDNHAGDRRLLLNAILGLGVFYTLLDTIFTWKRKLFLADYPLFIAGMESLFIGILCYFEDGLSSSFRYYYLLSIICCALRYSWHITAICYTLHCISYTILFFMVANKNTVLFFLTMVIIGWIAWASTALTSLLRRSSKSLEILNKELTENQAQLESRITERSRQLEEAQAQVLQQEKMAAFGLLAAGIAHEVGNPLTSISSMVQILQRKPMDDYTREKLELMNGQLTRISNTLREVTEFSRPANLERKLIQSKPILLEAMNIAKYYKRTRGKVSFHESAEDFPPVFGIHDQLVQVVLNLLLNAMDASGMGGNVELELTKNMDELIFQVLDNGPGVKPEDETKLFSPFFTTKKHGTGLGLFISRKIVEEHGGKLEYSSRLEGG